MITIKDIRKQEKEIFSKFSKSVYNLEAMKNDIILLLDNIQKTIPAIKYMSEYEYLHEAIIKWESFLSSRFSYAKTVRIPLLKELNIENEFFTRESKATSDIDNEEIKEYLRELKNLAKHNITQGQQTYKKMSEGFEESKERDYNLIMQNIGRDNISKSGQNLVVEKDIILRKDKVYNL